MSTAAGGPHEIRNLLERRRKRLVSISYPGRTVRVPRGEPNEARPNIEARNGSNCPA